MPGKKIFEGEVKSHRITIRFNDIEFGMVSSAAVEAGLTLSEYIREQVIHGKVENHYHIVAEFEKLDMITRELSGIANNLNQLTRYFHMGGLRSQSMMEELNKCMTEVMEMRKEILDLGGELRGDVKAHRK
ncbi:MAG: plasmid mobilization relaxosome protein MobC [Oscillospiraceae bacterium]|nr:plasmid mobilization relaxosome protein MobC [Oscillospiraceae bacterium]